MNNQNRRVVVAKRLQELLETVNAARRGDEMRPSHMASALGYERYETVEQWFSGEVEPTEKELERVAEFLGATPAWLKHGDKQMFPAEFARIPENPAEGVAWLMDLINDDFPYRLHLVRERSDAGNFALVKQFGEWRCVAYRTDYRISEEVGGSGEAALAHLLIIFRLLYKHYTKLGSKIMVKSYLLPAEQFDALTFGKPPHPLAILASQHSYERPWWEDIWDEGVFLREEHWPGFGALRQRFCSMIDSTPRFKALEDEVLNARV